MPTEIQERCEVIEESYEFTLSFAARGLSSEEDADHGTQIRYHLERAAEAIAGLEVSCAAAIKEEQLAPAERYEAFFKVLGAMRRMRWPPSNWCWPSPSSARN